MIPPFTLLKQIKKSNMIKTLGAELDKHHECEYIIKRVLTVKLLPHQNMELRYLKAQVSNENS